MSSLTGGSSHTRRMFAIALVVAAAAFVPIGFLVESGTGLAQTALASSENKGPINATTECVGTGPDSESAANTQLNSTNNNTITQKCEQTISSSTGDASQHATNTFSSNGDSSGNQVNQQSDQNIDD